MRAQRTFTQLTLFLSFTLGLSYSSLSSSLVVKTLGGGEISGDLTELTPDSLSLETPRGEVYLPKDSIDPQSWEKAQKVTPTRKLEKKSINQPLALAKPEVTQNHQGELVKEKPKIPPRLKPAPESLEPLGENPTDLRTFTNSTTEGSAPTPPPTSPEAQGGSLSSSVSQEMSSIPVAFLTQTFPLRYPKAFKDLNPAGLGEEDLKKFFGQLNLTQTSALIEDLEHSKNQFKLNDFLYYLLIKEFVEQIDKEGSEVKRTLLTWYILIKSHKDCILYYSEGESWADIYVKSSGPTPNLPNLNLSGQTFFLLGRIPKGDKGKLFGYKHTTPPKPFDLSLRSLPALRPNPLEKKLTFSYAGKTHELKVQVDQNVRDILKNYPALSPQEACEVPLSESLRSSFTREFRKAIARKPKNEMVAILSSLCQGAFLASEAPKESGQESGQENKQDNTIAKNSSAPKNAPKTPPKPIADTEKEKGNQSEPVSQSVCAEQTILSSQADALGRCAVFYQLGKEILSTPMVLLVYGQNPTKTQNPKGSRERGKTPPPDNTQPTHYSIGVGLKIDNMKNFRWKARTYTDCQPAGPSALSNPSEVLPLN